MLAPPSRVSAPKAVGVPVWVPRTVSAFYGTALPRPYLLLDKTSGQVVKERVAPPKVSDALLGESQGAAVAFPATPL